MVVSQYLAVRILHVLTAGVLFGSVTAVWLALWLEESVSVRLLAWLEGVFWGGTSLLVFTGLGNLVAFGTPPIDSEPGTILAVKLGCVFVVAAGSVVRTFAVLHLQRAGASRTTNPGVRVLYGLTGLGIGVVIVLAGVLTHG